MSNAHLTSGLAKSVCGAFASLGISAELHMIGANGCCAFSVGGPWEGFGGSYPPSGCPMDMGELVTLSPPSPSVHPIYVFICRLKEFQVWKGLPFYK